MKILVAPDSFKESMSAVEATNAIEAGIRTVLPQARIHCFPVADGGEGTVPALVTAKNGYFYTAVVRGPMGNAVNAHWGVLPDGTAVIETAAASGLGLVPPEQRNPLLANTYGTGQLIQTALNAGYKRIILGLGGSATCDGGAGALAALGAVFRDGLARPLPANPQGLLDLASIDLTALDPRIKGVTITIVHDVDNPLLGPGGAAAVFGPQKGAAPQTVLALERALTRLAKVAKTSLGKDIAGFIGSGAAGGLAAGLSAVADLKMQRGIDLILAALDFPSHLNGTRVVFTGEGKIDGQTAMGKAVAGIGALALAAGVPLIALCGALGTGYQELYARGVTAIQPIVPSPMPLAQALAQGPQLLAAATERALRLFLAGSPSAQ